MGRKEIPGGGEARRGVNAGDIVRRRLFPGERMGVPNGATKRGGEERLRGVETGGGGGGGGDEGYRVILPRGESWVNAENGGEGESEPAGLKPRGQRAAKGGTEGRGKKGEMPAGLREKKGEITTLAGNAAYISHQGQQGGVGEVWGGTSPGGGKKKKGLWGLTEGGEIQNKEIGR